MADIDNNQGEVLRVLQEDSVDNTKGVTQRVIEENTINNMRGVTKRVYVVGGGGTPINNQDITVTVNGVYTADEGYTGLGTVDVQVPTTAPEFYIDYYNNLETSSGVKRLKRGYHLIDFSDTIVSSYLFYYAYYNNTNVTGVVNFSKTSAVTVSSLGLGSSNAFNSCFRGCTGITGVNFSGRISLDGDSCFNSCFYGCTGITGTVDMSSVKKVWAPGNGKCCLYMFSGCTGITSVDLSGLEVVAGENSMGYTFSGCTNLASVDLSSLVYADSLNNTFQNCALTSVRFDSLTYIAGSMQYAFSGCTGLTDIYCPCVTFVSNTNAFGNILYGVTGCKIHFPKNLDPQTGSTLISGLYGYPNFSGTDTVLLFDLPSTFVLTGADTKEYFRNPKYDTATALAWRVKDSSAGNYHVSVDWTPYYTNTLNDPSVNGTLYSDAACTTAVTTISSIA